MHASGRGPSGRSVVGFGGVAAGALAALGLVGAMRPVAAQEQAVLDAWAAAWSSGSADRVAAVFAADGTYEDVPSETVVQGSAEIAAWAEGYFASVTEVRQSIESWAAIPSGAVVQWLVQATHATTGRPLSFRGASRLGLAAGKIAREIAYYDNATFITQAGGSCEAPTPDGPPVATPAA